MTFEIVASPSPIDLLVVSASASPTSRSERLGDYVCEALEPALPRATHIRLRELPAEPLLRADVAHPQIAEAVALVEQARAIAFVTPTYKASYAGLLKVFIDLLPQYALRGKAVLPLATGGTLAHVLMLDYALRPALQTMWPRHVTQGCFVLDRHLLIDADGGFAIADEALPMLAQVLELFREMTR